MIKRCSNCSGRLTFDIKSQAVKCSSCESCFDVTDIPETTDINPNNLDEVTKTMDCNVYICNSCGAEIIINDTEVSTFCVYCGNKVDEKTTRPTAESQQIVSKTPEQIQLEAEEKARREAEERARREEEQRKREEEERKRKEEEEKKRAEAEARGETYIPAETEAPVTEPEPAANAVVPHSKDVTVFGSESADGQWLLVPRHLLARPPACQDNPIILARVSHIGKRHGQHRIFVDRSPDREFRLRVR